MAHYRRDASDPARAEVTFAVEEPLRGQGVGTRLLERLAEIARARGIADLRGPGAGAESAHARRLRELRIPDAAARSTPKANGSRSSLTPTPDFEEKTAHRSEQAAAASMARLFEPRSVAVDRRQPRARQDRRGDPPQPARDGLSRRDLSGESDRRPRSRASAATPAWRTSTGPVDLAVISVPAAAVPAAVDDCVAKGVEGVVVITAGFGETGEEGRRMEAALLEKVRDAGMRMVGPNCMGLVNTDPAVRLNATFAPTYPPEGRVALSSQSGALGLALLDYARAAEPRHLDVRLGRQQGRRLGQRPGAVLGRGSADRRDPALPRELRQPGRLLPHRAPRRAAGSRSSP